jgi:hypothetical protein
MRKILFLSFLMLGFVAAVPQTQAAPVCSPISKTTQAGKVDGQFCIDPIWHIVTLDGTLTLADGTVYKLESDGAILMSLVKGKPVYSIQADIVIKDQTGALVWDQHATYAGASLSKLLSKLTSAIVDLPKTLTP